MQLVQVMFRYRTVPVEISLANMVLIPKGKGGYSLIGLVEVLWKVFALVVNFRIKGSVVLCDALHGFRTGRGTGTGTTTLESNLDQHLAGIAHEPIFQVFLYVRKAYDFLYWERCLELLMGIRAGEKPIPDP